MDLLNRNQFNEMHEFYLFNTLSLSNAIDLIIVNFSLFEGIKFAVFFSISASSFSIIK
jgi:hypothetical protein